MRTFPRLAPLVTAAFFLGAGCHKSSSQLSPAEAAAFDQAPPEVKEMWIQASEAAKTNGYVTAYNLFYQLGNADLSPSQKQAVTKASTALNERLLAGVDKNDPVAQSALEEMHRHPPSRQRAN